MLQSDNVLVQYLGRRAMYRHRRSQDFCGGHPADALPPGLASVVHTFEAIDLGSVSAPAVRIVVGGASE